MTQTPPPEEESHVRRLERRIAQLEQKFENQPADFIDAVRAQLARAYGLKLSRRDVIVSLAGGGVGAAALLALTPQQAAAAVVGNIGTNADPLDTVFATTLDPGTGATAADVKFDSQQPQDVTASRTLGTWETNGTEYSLFCIVSVVSDGTAASRAIARAHVNTSQSDNPLPVTEVQAADSASSATVSSATQFVVPPDHHYKVDASGIGTASLESWFEQQIGSN